MVKVSTGPGTGREKASAVADKSTGAGQPATAAGVDER